MDDKNSAILDKNNQAITSGWVTAYDISENTREYTEKSEEYLMVGVGMPAASFIDEPPAANIGFAICRNFDGNTWEQIEDHRGATVYDTTSLAASTIQALGPLTATQTLLAPTTSYDVWTNGAWVTSTIEQTAAEVAAAQAQQASLMAAAKSTISVWQTELLLGIINDTDKASLTAWVIYIKALQSVNTASLSTITWPDMPA